MQALIALLTCALALPNNGRTQTTWYVDDDAPADPAPGDPTLSDPLEDGTMDHPFDAIQEAIQACQAGDTVQVLDGLYTGPGNRNIDFGGLALTVRSADGPDDCIIDCQRQGRAFQFRFGEGEQSVLDGFTITGGYHTGYGGAIYCYNASSPTINDCLIVGNLSEGHGGAIACTDDSSPAIMDCMISENACAGSGGGVYCNTSDAVLTNCTLSWNLTIEDYGRGPGGGVFCTSSNVVLIRCTIIGNIAGNGAGVWASESVISVVNCVVALNSGASGGGLYCYRGTMACTNCAITRNMSENGGGAYVAYKYYGYDDPVFVNCTLSGNDATGRGGGLYCYDEITPVVSNCVLWGNTATEGPEIALAYEAELTVSYSDVEGGVAATYVAPDCALHWGEGNVNSDPLFTDPDRGDYRPSAGSPCIDAADNTAVPEDVYDLDDDGDVSESTPLDLAENVRFVDDPTTDDTGVQDPPDGAPVVDMGAYEYQPCFGDLDGDGDVDLEDLTLLLANYGVTSGAGWEDGDLDSDGDVDLDDLSVLLAVYGRPCA
jgi:predicted outer membrane repeat protein